MDICITKFVLSLHNNNNFSRKDVLGIEESVKTFLIDPLLNTLIAFAACNFLKNTVLYNTFHGLITSFRNPFKFFNTDHLLFKTLQDRNYLEKTEQFIIDKKISVMHKSGSLVAEKQKVTGVLMPLKFQFKKYFEKDELLEKFLRHMEYLQCYNKLTNFVQGDLWNKKKEMYPEKTLLPSILHLRG